MDWRALQIKSVELKLVVNDSLASIHAKLMKVTSDFISLTTPTLMQKLQKVLIKS
jgi:hypothetical protein